MSILWRRHAHRLFLERGKRATGKAQTQPLCSAQIELTSADSNPLQYIWTIAPTALRPSNATSHYEVSFYNMLQTIYNLSQNMQPPPPLPQHLTDHGHLSGMGLADSAFAVLKLKHSWRSAMRLAAMEVSCANVGLAHKPYDIE